MKRLFCSCLLSLFILAILAGCESPNTTATNQPTATPTASSSTPTSGPTATETATSITNSADAQSMAQVATQYYNAVKARNYAQAYTYLAANATNANGQQLTLSSFEQLAQTMDSQEGAVTDFTVTPYPPNVIMTISRTLLAAYHAHLQMKQEGRTWKITSIDRI